MRCEPIDLEIEFGCKNVCPTALGIIVRTPFPDYNGGQREETLRLKILFEI